MLPVACKVENTGREVRQVSGQALRVKYRGVSSCFVCAAGLLRMTEHQRTDNNTFNLGNRSASFSVLIVWVCSKSFNL